MTEYDFYLEGLLAILNATPIEREFGRFLARIGKNEENIEDALWLRLLGVLLLQQGNEGHSCLDLPGWQEQIPGLQAKAREQATALEEQGLDPARILRALEVLQREDLPAIALKLREKFPQLLDESSERCTPLILRNKGCRLYLHKLFSYEQEISRWIYINKEAEELGYSPEKIRDANIHFQQSTDSPDFQQLAVAKVLQHRFAVITGGPGTGKTTVLSVILALLLQQHPEKGYRIALAAPTGKAKARMQEAITSGVPQLCVKEEIKEKMLALKPTTVDAMLKNSPETMRPHFNEKYPLPADFVVVDEASMLSLPAMAMLLRALKPGTRLLLAGDKNQLPSVEVGNVFADICNCLDDKNIASLVKNHRSRSNDVLVSVASRLVEPETDWAVLAQQLYDENGQTPSQPEAEFKVLPLPEIRALKSALRQLLEQWEFSANGRKYRLLDWKQQRGVDQYFLFANAFKILAGNREGIFGVENLNRLMAEILDISPNGNGTPLMILENDRNTGLNNGDIGIVFDQRVYFPNPEYNPEQTGSPKYLVFNFAALPPFEPVYAMTIHKSQGSGYEMILMILPDRDNPVLSRELVYTGITRTKLKFRMWANPEILTTALQRKTKRNSGISVSLEL